MDDRLGLERRPYEEEVRTQTTGSPHVRGSVQGHHKKEKVMKRLRLTRLAAALLAIGLAFPAAAFAVTSWNGGPANNNHSGTGGADALDGHAGNDKIHGLGGADYLLGGTGKDQLFGGAGSDLIRGQTGDDLLYGESGNDTIFAGAGHDISYGGPGDDVLWAIETTDTTGDTLNGGDGNDVFHTADHEADTITCGPGKDVVYPDALDTVPGDCEFVIP
jgi:Ca2+-binding RTX toxin-like protein